MGTEKIKNQEIQDIVVLATASHFAIEPEIFRESRNRSDNSSYQRQVCFYLIRRRTFLSNEAIGGIFGLKEAAVRHGLKRISNDLDIKDKRTMTNIRSIEILINNFNQKKTSEIKKYTV